MNGRRKDAEDNIEQVEHYRNHNPDDDIPHKACDIVCHKGKKDRCQPYGHNPHVGDDVANTLKEFQRRQKPAGKEKKRHQKKNCQNDRPGNDFRKDVEECRKDSDQAGDDQDADNFIISFLLGLLLKGGYYPENQAEEDMNNANRKREVEHGYDSGPTFNTDRLHPEEPVREVAEKLSVEDAEEDRINGG